jgi:hypothetical protein
MRQKWAYLLNEGGGCFITLWGKLSDKALQNGKRLTPELTERTD